MFSMFSSARPEADELPVLIRLRDLSRRNDAPATPVPMEPMEVAEESAEVQDALVSATVPGRQDEFALDGPNVDATLGSSEMPVSTVAPESPPVENISVAASAESSAVASTPFEQQGSSPGPEAASPARRQRQRREASPAKRDWSHTMWQGTVGLLLVSLFVIVYFIMVGGGKKQDAAGSPGQAADGAPATEDLQSPEISIPESGTNSLEMAASNQGEDSPAEDTDASSSRHGAKSKDFDVSAEVENSADGFNSPPQKETAEYGETPAVRKAAKPRSEGYPVTPAAASYPATDPNKFRYPPDSQLNLPPKSRSKRTANRPTPPGGEWSADEQPKNR